MKNEYQEALNIFQEIVTRVNHYDGYMITKSDLEPIIESIKTLQEVVNDNFVYLFTHNGIKYAFRNINQLYDFLNENKLNKVTIQSIQYYEKKSIDGNEDETNQ